jgi:hypothetical protein
MLRLYRTSDSPLADEVEGALQRMSLAREVIRVRSEADMPKGSALSESDLPALFDSGEVVTGEEALREHIAHLRDFVAGWRRFQSDTCELDAGGNVC